MKKVVYFLVFLSFGLHAQSFTDSNLPIVVITTDLDSITGEPIEIPDDPKVLATMKIIFRPDSSRNYLTDQYTPGFLNYNGRIGIELRGSTSQLLPKKPYGFTTLQRDNQSNNNVSILGMPKENDWILGALDYDSSLVRNYLSFELSRSLGNYAARGVYCEVVINGDYKGLYVLYEKLKIETERINLVKQTLSDTVGVNVTGGYITKADKMTGGDTIAWSMPTYNTYGLLVDFIHEHPKQEDITFQQNAYIFNHFSALQHALDSKNGAISDGYPSLIDLPSFVDFMIINELASNVDAYQYSTFFHKDRGGKLRAGPVWDLNLTYGNDLLRWRYDRSKADIWQFDNGDNTGARFWKDLYDDPVFKCYLSKRWKEVTAKNQALDLEVITRRIDQLVARIAEATVREQERWNTVGAHAHHITFLKAWLQTRVDWLHENLSDDQMCSNLSLPPLVITKIHYNPKSEQGKASNELEFIEITNNGSQSVDVTGLYLRELGVSYQFPVHRIIEAYEKIYLASNADAFKEFYGMEPFGQFARNLSNKSQKLVLADAYGNSIDQVEYFDTAPWPTEADGTGPYLELSNVNDDNSLASSWITSRLALGLENYKQEADLFAYPNPSQKTVTIGSKNMLIESYEIMDMMGQQIKGNTRVEGSTFTIDLEELPSATYLLKISEKAGISHLKRVIKL